MRESELISATPDAAFLAQAFNTSRDCVAMLATDATVLCLNAHGAAALGFAEPSRAFGLNWLDVWSDEDRSAAERAVQAATRGEGTTFLACSRVANGEPRRWKTRLEPVGTGGRVLANSRDITEQDDIARALERSHRLQHTLIEALSQIYWHVDLSRGVTTRRGYQAFTGQPDDPANMDGWLDLVHADDRAAAKFLADQASVHGTPLMIEYRLLHKSGEWRWVEDRAMPLKNAAGEVTDWVGIIIDRHARKITEQALRKSVEHLRLAVESTGLGTWDVDIRTEQRDWSPEMFDLMRLPRSAIPSRRLFIESVHPDDRVRVDRELKGNGEFDEAIQVSVFRLQLPSGDEPWIEVHERTFCGPDGVPIRRVGAMQDITKRKLAEQEVWRAAHTDPLTGIPNRALFQTRLEGAIEKAACHGHRLGLLLVDLDRFKDVNDTLGHDAGDALLRSIAERLEACIPPGATVARLGGDEFGVIVPLEPALDLGALAADLIAVVGKPLDYAGRDMDGSASIGWSVFPDQAQKPSDLLKKADLALYAAKSAGRNRATVFLPAMQTELERRLNVLRHAREALARSAIVPFYQPKVCLKTGAVVGFEALLRWTDQTGLGLPGAWREAFEDPEISVRIGARMLDAVVADMQAWNESAVTFGHVALNVSSPEFQGGSLAARLVSALQSAQIPARQLEIEVTERVLLDDGTGSIGAALRAMHDAGILIALDDFGTGYASLTHLTQFPVSWVKIDKSFTSNLETDASAAAIVNAVVGLAHAINLRVVAEGVETPHQLSFLQKAGCDLAQGFLLAKPMSGTRVPHFLRIWPRRSTALLGGSRAAGLQRDRRASFG